MYVEITTTLMQQDEFNSIDVSSTSAMHFSSKISHGPGLHLIDNYDLCNNLCCEISVSFLHTTTSSHIVDSQC